MFHEQFATSHPSTSQSNSDNDFMAIIFPAGIFISAR
jgi:hypothetical protein